MTEPSLGARHRVAFITISRRLANTLEAACGPGLAVSTDVDLRLRDVPLLNRRPDVVLYDAALPDDAGWYAARG